MDIRKVKKLIEMMEESDISEIEIKEGEDSVRITRGGVVVPLSDHKESDHKESDQRVSDQKVSDHTPIDGRRESTDDQPLTGDVVGAPMVGTFYSAPSPSSPPFVETGDLVKEGDTLCIIESMKMMNHIKAERAGKIEAILVANEEPVEFDQPLFTIS
jgi:acetyl-CoA carboxylase biotin carboxyl carrier protein